MAAELSLKFFFLAVSNGADNGDLIFEYRLELAQSPLPAEAPVPTISVERKEGGKTRGRVSLLLLDNDGPVSGASVGARVEDGKLPNVAVPTKPLRTADSLIWRFFVSVQPGGKQTVVSVTADAAPAKQVKVQTPVTSANLPKPQAAPGPLNFVPRTFPRLIVGIDIAPIPVPSPALPSPFSASVADIAPCLQQVLDRLTDPQATEKALGATLATTAAGAATPPSAPVGAGLGQTDEAKIRDAERLWANQVAEILICTPYGGPNALYGLNDDDLLARTIQDSSAKSPTAIYPIAFACQHLATFAVASRGRGLFKPDFSGKRLQLLNAGSTCAATWTSTKIGKWIVTSPDGSQPEDSPDGGKGDPNNLNPDEKLETSPLLFKVKDVVAATHPFGSAAVFCYANRPARQDQNCSVFGGVETCLLKNKDGSSRIEEVPIFEEREVVIDGVKKKKKVLAKNPDGTIKTFKRTARTVWPLHNKKTGGPGSPLADNTAGAHLAFVLRTDNKTQLFQTLDTGGVNVPNRGEFVEIVPKNGGFHGGIFDDPATSKVNPGKAPLDHDTFRGVGVIEKIDAAEADKLIAHVGRLKQARPLGLCRFVLLRRDLPITHSNYARFKDPSQNFLIYASPMLPMYDTDPVHNFPISRCLWSLRDFPDAANVEAMWFFYVPQGPLAQAMMGAQRGDRVRKIAQDSAQFMRTNDRAKYAPNLKANEPKILADFSVPVLDITVEPSGQVRLVASYKSKLLNGRGLSLLHGLEGRYGSKALLPLDQSFVREGQSTSGLPAYFRSV